MHGKEIAVVLVAVKKQCVKTCCSCQLSNSHDFNKCVRESELVKNKCESSNVCKWACVSKRSRVHGENQKAM